MRPLTSFSANEREVINERRHGWERASCAQLAMIFGTTARVIALIAKPSSAVPDGRTAGDRSNGDTGHIAKLKSAHFHEALDV